MRAWNVASLLLATSGLIILTWVGWLTWYDTTWWNKNITTVFFESRTGETISLGINMKIIHYFLIGLVLSLSSLLAFRFGGSSFLPWFRHFGEKLARAWLRLVVGVILMSLLGVSLYLSPLRNNTVAIVGVFAFLSTIVVALLAIVQIEFVYVGEKNGDMDKTLIGENHADKKMHTRASSTVKFFDISHTSKNLRKTKKFRMDIYSSKSQITLSSRTMHTGKAAQRNKK